MRRFGCDISRKRPLSERNSSRSTTTTCCQESKLCPSMERHRRASDGRIVVGVTIEKCGFHISVPHVVDHAHRRDRLGDRHGVAALGYLYRAQLVLQVVPGLVRDPHVGVGRGRDPMAAGLLVDALPDSPPVPECPDAHSASPWYITTSLLLSAPERSFEC